MKYYHCKLFIHRFVYFLLSGQKKPYHKCCAGEKKPEEKSDSPSSSTCKHEKGEEKDQRASFSVQFDVELPKFKSPTSSLMIVWGKMSASN